MLDTIIGMSAQTIRISVPLILAALGGVCSERSGVINVALEGIMLNGAFCAVLGTYYFGNPWAGLVASVLGGILTAVIHGIITIRYKADQIISGIAINLLALGVTKFFLKVIFHSSSNSTRIIGFEAWEAHFQSMPVIKDIIGDPLIFITILSIVAVHFSLFRTPWGLRLRAVGEHPQAADTLGVHVNRMRIMGVLLSGCLAGLAGAWLAFDQHQFTDNMSAGRGFIALAAMIIGKWTPLGAVGAALLFGFAEGLQMQLQAWGVHIPTQFVQMTPYLLTIVVLAGLIGKATPPSSLGLPYKKGD